MKVPVTWEMCGYVEIPGAKTVEEAMEIFNETSDEIPLPTDGEYVDSSFHLSSDDVDEVKAMIDIE